MSNLAMLEFRISEIEEKTMTDTRHEYQITDLIERVKHLENMIALLMDRLEVTI